MGNLKFDYRGRLWAWLPTGYPKSVLKNGLGRFVLQLQRLTFHFCQSRHDSNGVRHYIEHDLINFADANPGIVVYLRPVMIKAPYMVGEYLNGRRASIHLSECSRQDINRWVNYLRTRSGQRIVRFEAMQHTEYPSIQGIWNPYTNVLSDRNVATYPDEKLGRYVGADLTATERVLQMAKENKLNNVRIIEADENVEASEQTVRSV